MGFIKIHRNIRDWGWYDDANTLAVWIHLLIDANYEEKVWHGETVGIGSLITSTARLSDQTGLSAKQIRTCLERLSEEGKIITKGASKWTKITICNYESYMLDGEDAGQTNGEQMASKGQADGEQMATPKEEKKVINKESNSSRRFVKPTIEQIADYCKEKGYDVEAERFFNYYESKGWVVGKSPMKDWKAAVRTWAINQRSSSSQPSSSPQVAPAPSSKEEAMEWATHPTEDEIKLRYDKAFLPIHPMLEGETKEQYRERIRPQWNQFYREWIARRVEQVNNKY